MTNKAKKAGAKLIVAAIVNNLDKCTIYRTYDSRVTCIALGDMQISPEYDYRDCLSSIRITFRGESFFDGITIWDLMKLKRLIKKLQKQNTFEKSLGVLKDLTSYVNQTIGD